MPTPTIEDLITNAEYLTKKLKFIKSHFPDVKVSGSVKGWLNISPTFVSKKVNEAYTDFEFSRGWRDSSLKVAPFTKLYFEHGKEEEIKIHSSPKSSRLAYIGYERRKKSVSSGVQTPITTTHPTMTSGTLVSPATPIIFTHFPSIYNSNNLIGSAGKSNFSDYETVKILRFGRVAINFKSHGFNQKMMNECQRNMMDFVNLHVGVEIDMKHLDARLKKLLALV